MRLTKLSALSVLLLSCFVPTDGMAQTCQLVVDGRCSSVALQNWTYNSATGVLTVQTTAGNAVVTTDPSAPPPSDPTVAITGFTVNGGRSASVTVGDPVTFSMSVVNATSCVFTGGNSAWRNGSWPASTRRIVVDHEGTLTYTLSCSGNGGPVSSSVTVTGRDEVSEGTDVCTKNTQAREVISWGDEFREDFPGPRYETDVYVRAPEGSGKAMRIETGDFVGTGTLVNVYHAIDEPSRQRIAISPCQGDFDVPQECRIVGNLSAGIQWSTQGTLGACRLQPNTTYYVNLGWTGECDRCTFRLQTINRDW